MTWKYSSVRVHELVKAQKCLAPGQSATFENDGPSRKLRVALELVDGGIYNLELAVTAPVPNDPTTYEAALLLDKRRVRGVGFSTIERRIRYKIHIPYGWHENVHDYNLQQTDLEYNRHDPLPDLEVNDLHEFLRKVCARWNIQLEFEQEQTELW